LYTFDTHVFGEALRHNYLTRYLFWKQSIWC